MIRILLILSGFWLVTFSGPAESCRAGPGVPRETKERLSPEKMEAMVAGPLRAAQAGDLAKARRAFDGLVEKARRRHGSASVREADLHTAFGVQLYTLGGDLGREDLQRLAPTYLKLAVDASKRAFGPRHPETALALHSYADVLVGLADGAPPEEAEIALIDAYSIRQATLGASNVETLAAMRALAQTKASRFREAGKLKEAAELFRQAIAISARNPPAENYLSPLNMRLDLVNGYFEAGQTSEALLEARIAADEVAREQAGATDDSCNTAVDRAISIADDLQAERPVEAEALRRMFAPHQGCLEALLEHFDKEAATD